MSVVLVTGAGSGFGKAIVDAFASRGDVVIATARRMPGDADGREHAARAKYLELDVRDPEARQRVVNAVLERYGRLDVLVNNAGILTIGAIEDTPPEVTASVMDTNFAAPLELCRAVLPAMRSHGSGRIINVSAIGAVLCTPFLATYCASKHALDAASAALDLEVRAFGIRVVSVLPGLFRTSIGTKQLHVEASGPYRRAADTFRAGFMNRLELAPSDFAAVTRAIVDAAATASPRARYVVGDGLATSISPLVTELELLHEAEATRAAPPIPGP